MRISTLMCCGMSAGVMVFAAGCATTSLQPAELSVTERPAYVDKQDSKASRKAAARVVELRGDDGELARISLGTKQGAAPGQMIEFFVFVDYSDLVEDAKDQPSPVAYGTVTATEERFSWVKVKDPKREIVRRGHYARIAPKQPESPVEKVKGLFTKEGKENETGAEESAEE